MPHDDDLELMARIAREDQAALAALYRRYAGLVYSVAMRVLQNAIWAEEAMQDTFMKVWREPRKWNPAGGKLINWLVTVARFTAIDRLRKERRQPTLVAPALEDFPHLAADTKPVDDLTFYDVHVVQMLMEQLPPAQMQVIELAYWYGMTHSEISAHLKLPLGTVKSRLLLGMQKLRDMARAHDIEPNRQD